MQSSLGEKLEGRQLRVLWGRIPSLAARLA
jgi:hypothetical protein